MPSLPTQPSDPSHKGLEVLPADAQGLQKSLDGEVSRYRALVEMDTLAAKAGTVKNQHGVLLDRLDEWPDKIDFQNGIVQYPPKIQPVPVKPVFLDIAWNFIEYPGSEQAERREEGEEEMAGQEKKGLLGRLWGR
jgi:signal recognition particle subunit SRP68